MTIRNLHLMLAAIVIAGCATTANYEKVLNSYVGLPEDVLLSRWGAPDNTYSMSDGKKILSYNRARTIQTGGVPLVVPMTTTSQAVVTGNVQGTITGTSTSYVPMTTPVQNVNLSCSARFTVANGITVSWSYEGNDCRANDPGDNVNTPEKNLAALEASKQKRTEFVDNVKTRAKAICNKPEYAPFYKKTACLVTDITFEQLADKSKISSDEKAVLPRVKNENKEYVHSEIIAAMRKTGNAKDMRAIEIFERNLSKLDDIALALYEERITWGEYNQQRRDLYLAQKAELSALK